MRDSGEHFPAFNVAIRNHGVKKSGKAISLAQIIYWKCCSRLFGGYVGELDARKTVEDYGTQPWGFATRRVNWSSYRWGRVPQRGSS